MAAIRATLARQAGSGNGKSRINSNVMAEIPPYTQFVAANGAWQMASRAAPPSLAAYVRDYQGYEEFNPSLIRRRELPHGGVVLVINFGARWQIADPRHGTQNESHESFVAGVDDFVSLVNCSGRAYCLQVNFTPIGARRYFGLPMRDLARRVVDLDDLLGSGSRNLADRLFQAPDWKARFAIMDEAIVSRLARMPEEDRGIRWAWDRIVQSNGLCSMAELARTLDCSRKHLASRFHDQVGLPPKTIAGIARFNRALALIGRAQKPDLALVAAEAGYFDQSHFNRDFMALSGITPGEFLRARLSGGDGVAA